ncbi:hypothetical protein [Sphingomonas lenta]|uniref:DUF2306 domain-containing protein n=1 Tax=Sphingomonas lenta TaxID=1141887 RepID=A0A2A2SCX6_9SPHN|nr:hypothetical protein [Sphingomonas lenta]PAX07108.1 hypothetical protein CKY28_13765 [Sphingomonas lenta]
MATVAFARRDPLEAERRFFFGMAIAIGATVVLGFGSHALLGRVDLGRATWLVHLHGATFMGWVALFVAQSWLVASGDVATHRRLGMLSAAYAVFVVWMGLAIMMSSYRRGTVPPFFPPNVFLFMNVGHLLTFGGLTAAAVAMRRDAGWHKRLMLCGMLVLMGPAIGRLLPMPLLGRWNLHAVFAVLMLYALVAMVRDLRMRGSVHPAYRWGLGVFAAVQLLIEPLAWSGPGLAATRAVTG